MNKHIDELKRFIYSATVTCGSGSQSFYIDAKNREEADARAANKESDGMYADDSEVTDLDALEYEDETTVDDFGDFPPISREQSLLAKLEAAEQRSDDLAKAAGCKAQKILSLLARLEVAEKEIGDWRSIAEAAAQDDADWHKLADSKNKVISHLAQGIIKLKEREEHNVKILNRVVRQRDKAFADIAAAEARLLVPVIRQHHAEWSNATFGNVGPIGPLKHLSKEALETAAAPNDLSEWADMQFLFWDAQRRAGITDGQLEQAMIEKLEINKSRTWPEPKDGEPREHIRACNPVKGDK